MTTITIRCYFTTGAYHAKAPGYRVSASSTESAKKAADRLVEKLRPGVEIERIEAVQDGGPAALNLYHYHFKPVEGA